MYEGDALNVLNRSFRLLSADGNIQQGFRAGAISFQAIEAVEAPRTGNRRGVKCPGQQIEALLRGRLAQKVIGPGAIAGLNDSLTVRRTEHDNHEILAGQSRADGDDEARAFDGAEVIITQHKGRLWTGCLIMRLLLAS